MALWVWQPECWQTLTTPDVLVVTLHGWHHRRCMNGWMWGNCKALWIKVLYKCNPFIYFLDREILNKLPRELSLRRPHHQLSAVVPQPQPAGLIVSGDLRPGGRLRLCRGDLPERGGQVCARLSVPLLRRRRRDPPRTGGPETRKHMVREDFNF